MTAFHGIARRALVAALAFVAACAGAPTPDASLDLVPIAAGAFVMGSDDGDAKERPAHRVTITRPFWIGRHEVTQAQYAAVVGMNPSHCQGANVPDAPRRPVEMVSWQDAVAYCRALTARDRAAGRIAAGYQYRLPTEAEWEYCCRAGTTTPWHTGARLDAAQANFAGARADAAWPDGQPVAVGSYAPNAWGLHDMHGNVAEWCLDAYAAYGGAAVDPYGARGDIRVFRGGSWGRGIDADACRSSYRCTGTPGGSSYAGVGFRIVLGPTLVE